MTLAPNTTQELQEIVRSTPKLLARGGGTKNALSTPREGQTVVDMRGLSGVVEYTPDEYVIVAGAGTPLAEIEQLLAQNGQYLPFDPPFVEAGATLGGTVAAGLSGPLRQRYGGVRDFILGVKLVEGEGKLIQGGGKVVKNAAGFDLPKLMVGSLGRLGLMVELAFKVFPFPRATATLKITFDTLSQGLEALYKLSASATELYALDLETNPATLTLRLGGLAEALPERIERLRSLLGNPPDTHTLLLEGEREQGFWRHINRLEWGHGYLLKVPLQPSKIPALEAQLGLGMRRYSAAGNLLYLSWLKSITELDAILKSQGLSGLVLRGRSQPLLNETLSSPLIGVDSYQVFGARVSQALDPRGRFSPEP